MDTYEFMEQNEEGWFIIGGEFQESDRGDDEDTDDGWLVYESIEDMDAGYKLIEIFEKEFEDFDEETFSLEEGEDTW